MRKIKGESLVELYFFHSHMTNAYEKNFLLFSRAVEKSVESKSSAINAKKIRISMMGVE